MSENGIGKNPDFNVEGIEYSLDGDPDLPILQVFINEYKQYKKSNDGYYAVRTWEDEMERTIKQLYYHFDGTPMANDDGEFGVIVDYLDEGTIKYTNVDANGNMIENNNGVAFTIKKESSSGVLEISFNLEGMPHANNDLAYYYRDRELLNHGYIDKIYVHNSDNELIEFWQPRLADTGWEPIKCTFDEITYDEKSRPLSQYFKDINGDNVGDSDGDSYTIWEYDDKNGLEILSLYNTKDELRQRIRTKRDEKGRVLEQSYLKKDNSFAELDRGYSGEIFKYDDDERKKTVSFIDSNGKVCNNKDGFAHRISWYDKMGRLIAQKDDTIDGVVHGFIVFREFIDSEKRECAYYVHREDDQGHTIPNDNGSVYEYFEDDIKGRTIKNLYLSVDKLPVPDSDGDFGLGYEYDDQKRLTIITCLDENGLPHNNNIGYGIIHIYKDDKEREIKRMYYTVDGTPIVLPQLKGCYGEKYEYPNEDNKIVGYLNEYGEITTNNFGYAYREECLNPETGTIRFFFYDKNRNNTQSLEDEKNKEFGYAIDFDDNWRYVVSLGKDGQVANNASGYAIKHELYKEGRLCFYKYQDANGKPVADNLGDYGTEIQRSEDGSLVRLVSLNKRYERHINDQGFCICDIITDMAGDQVRIWRDMEENQVLPKIRFFKRLKKRIFPLKKKEKKMPIFNCRQMGAIFDCVLGNVEGEGLGKKHGLRNTYVLLKYDGWKFGDDSGELVKIISSAKKQSKHLVLLPVTLNGSLLQEVGEIIEFDFPSGQIGMRFKDWGINIETLQIIFEKKQEWENT